MNLAVWSVEVPMSGPQPSPVTLPARRRALLESLARRPSSPQQLARRAQIVLAAADGANNEQIARRLQLCRETVGT